MTYSIAWPMVVIRSASSSAIVKPYSCCIASWISTNASESRPIASNVAFGIVGDVALSSESDPVDEDPLERRRS